jgi:hypothetical protein
MAHSIQTVGDRAESFNDLDLLVLICLAGQEVTSSAPSYPRLASFVKRWKHEVATYGPGTIDLRLDDLVTDDLVTATGALSELDSMLTALRARLEQHGRTIPAAVLNSECPTPGVTFYDYPTMHLANACDRLAQLVRRPADLSTLGE